MACLVTLFRFRLMLIVALIRSSKNMRNPCPSTYYDSSRI